MNKLVKFLSISATMMLLPYIASAVSVPVTGGAVEVTGATSISTLENGDVVIVFADAENAGTLTVPTNKDLRAHILAVGGGGAGGSVGNGIKDGAAGGGGAGGVSDHERILTNGTYTITIGKGGQKVTSTSRSWVGDDGKPTWIKIGGENVSAAVGGGGGGSIKLNGKGTKGGCGGGGSWYHGIALNAGIGTEGQGWDGGTPEDETVQNGGGGGGAAVDSSVGYGKADGTPGAGHVSDITGTEVTYAQGGRGGNRSDPDYVPADGAYYGFGGDGAVSEKGGAGADGIVIIRIEKMFEYKYLQIPEYLVGIIFTDQVTQVSFDYNSMPASWKAGVEFSGTNSVYCWYGPNESSTNGIGRYSFTLTPKDEYLWDLGDGKVSDSPFTAYWRILEPGTIGQADVKIWKNVDWSEGGKARIKIDVDLIPEIKEVELNVLFLSGLCSAHGYSPEVAKAGIDAAAEVANVDYYFYNTVDTTSNYAPIYSGTVPKGEKFNKTLEMKTNNHAPMYGFYETLSQLIAQGKKYDYIIFSFDRTKIATSFPAQHSAEQTVANFLKPLYDSKSIIWLVDDMPENCTEPNIQQKPWYPSQLVFIQYGNTTTGAGCGWTTLEGYRAKHGGTATAAAAYRALIGLFDPAKYPGPNANVAGYATPTMRNNPSGTQNYAQLVANQNSVQTTIAASAGDPIANQVIYNNAENVRDMIREVVVAKSFTGIVNDNVRVEMGLDVQDANATWTTNEEVMGWAVVKKPEELTFGENGVVISLSNLVSECWIKLLIDVEDTGAFLNSEEGAIYNERTGKWEKDPNDGPVVVRLRPDGEEAILAQAEASTSIPWAYTAHKVRAELVHGQGTWSINGFIEKDEVSVGAGYSPEVVFRGDTGWVLDYLEIDGQVIEDFDPSTYHWIFANISADHVIKFGFEKASFKLLRAVQRYPWNNLVDIDYYINAESQLDSCIVGRLVFFVEYEGEDGKTVRKQLKTFRDNDIMFWNWYNADPQHHWDPYWTSLKDAAHWPFGNDVTIQLGGKNHSRFNRTGYHRITWDSNKDGVSIFQKKKVSYYMYLCEGEEKDEE